MSCSTLSLSCFLKFASAAVLLVYFPSLNEIFTVFCFTSKALFCSWEDQSLEFYILKFYDIIRCLNIKNKENILLNNLGSKHNLLMKFSNITKEKNSMKNYTKTTIWKVIPDSFVFAKN